MSTQGALCPHCRKPGCEHVKKRERPSVVQLVEEYQRSGQSHQSAIRNATYDMHRFDIEHADLSNPDTVRGFLLMLLDRTQ